MSKQLQSNGDIKFGLDSFKRNWFTENGTNSEDYAYSMEVERILHHEKSEYQDILVFESKAFGKCLALDNAIQFSEKDEFVYHEMLSFLPLNSHPNPRKVLIVGGGDGGVAREVAKHHSVESIILCDIDKAVINVSKTFFPHIAKGFESPKLTLKIGDGIQYLKEHVAEFDVIITDSSDPYAGPATDLFEQPYFELLKVALKPGGVLASQTGENFWTDIHNTRKLLDISRKMFPVVDYASILVPSYPIGQLGILLCGTSPDTNFRKIIHDFSQSLEELQLKFYTPYVHRAAFAVPLSVMEELDLNRESFLY